jgi:hypothetical protein
VEGLVDWTTQAMLRLDFELANAQDMGIPRDMLIANVFAQGEALSVTLAHVRVGFLVRPPLPPPADASCVRLFMIFDV